jgi:hypothetical protein
VSSKFAKSTDNLLSIVGEGVFDNLILGGRASTEDTVNVADAFLSDKNKTQNKCTTTVAIKKARRAYFRIHSKQHNKQT